MRVLGVDLAWGAGETANETGVVVSGPDGRIIDADWTRGVPNTIGWIEQVSGDDALLMIDAPLMVLNSSGQRQCEREVGQRYGRWKVSANSTNLASDRMAGVELREALEARGWTYDDGVEGQPIHGRVISECYPYTAIVGAPELGYETERPTYKRKPASVPTEQWRVMRAMACDVLIQRMRKLVDGDAPIDIDSHPQTAMLLNDSPTADRDYKHREDLIDACLAAWTAQLWLRHGQTRCQVLGSTDPATDERGRRATIIAPARDEQRQSKPSRNKRARSVRSVPRDVAEQDDDFKSALRSLGFSLGSSGEWCNPEKTITVVLHKVGAFIGWNDVGWPGPASPVLQVRDVVHLAGHAGKNRDYLALEISNAEERYKAALVVCQFCHQSFVPGSTSNGNICHGCATLHLGVVY